MERIWLKSYPAGVPADIDPSKYRSLIELFDSSIAKYRDRPAFHSMGKSITFDQLDKRSRDFGAWLQAQRPRQGRARRDHDAELPAVPDRDVRHRCAPAARW